MEKQKRRARSKPSPDQHRLRGTVYIERLRQAGEPWRYSEDPVTVTDIYSVVTQRLGREWTYIVELQGQQMVLPGKVLDQILRHRRSIIRGQGRVTARYIHERPAPKVCKTCRRSLVARLDLAAGECSWCRTGGPPVEGRQEPEWKPLYLAGR